MRVWGLPASVVLVKQNTAPKRTRGLHCCKHARRSLKLIEYDQSPLSACRAKCTRQPVRKIRRVGFVGCGCVWGVVCEELGCQQQPTRGSYCVFFLRPLLRREACCCFRDHRQSWTEAGRHCHWRCVLGFASQERPWQIATAAPAPACCFGNCCHSNLPLVRRGQKLSSGCVCYGPSAFPRKRLLCTSSINKHGVSLKLEPAGKAPQNPQAKRAPTIVLPTTLW